MIEEWSILGPVLYGWTHGAGTRTGPARPGGQCRSVRPSTAPVRPSTAHWGPAHSGIAEAVA